MRATLRHDFASDLHAAQALRERVPAAYHLLQLSGCLSLRAQQARRSDLVLTLEGLDASMYHCESTGRDLSSDAVAAALGLLAVVSDEIAQAERAAARPAGDHECQCQQHDCTAGVTCAKAASRDFCARIKPHVCTACEAHQ